MTTSSSALVDALEGEKLTPGEEGREGRGQLDETSVTVPSMLTVPPTDERIIANLAELVRWDAYNKQLSIVLFLSTKGAANSFLVRFAGRPNSRLQPNEQAAWRAMVETYLNSSMQRRRTLMRKLNGMIMMLNQDPDKYLTEVFQERDGLEHIGESFAEARILYIILEGLSDEYELIRFATERDPEISLKKVRLRGKPCTPTASRAVTAQRFRAGKNM